MKLMSIEPSFDGKTKFTANFKNDDGTAKKVKFGIEGSYTYTDGAPNKTRKAYLARHIHDIDSTDPTSRGNLSYYITWGPYRNIGDNIRAYKKKFGV